MNNRTSQMRVSDAIFTIDAQLNVLNANRSFLLFFQLPDSFCSLRDFLDPSDVENLSHFLETFDRKNNNSNFLANLKIAGQQLLCILHIIKEKENFKINLTEFTYYKEQLCESVIKNETLQKVLTHFDSYFFTFDGSKVSFSNSKDLIPIFENSLGEFKDFLPEFFKIDLTTASSVKMFNRLFTNLEKKKGELDYRILLQDSKHIFLSTNLVKTSYGDFIVGVINMNGVKLPHETGYYQKDGLTDLFNKKTITEMARKKISEGKTGGALFIVDLDKFKECNDNFGHAFGDTVLLTTAKVIKDAARGLGIAGRIGGDEFLVLIDTDDEETVRNVARNIRLGIQWGIPALNPESVVTCSIGIARFPQNGKTYDDIFNVADRCLYIAKSKGRNCYIIYKPEVHDKMIIQAEESSRNISSGKFYMDNVESQQKILSLINKNNPFLVKNTLLELQKYLGVHKVTVYNYIESEKSFIPKLILGIDQRDFRSEALKRKDYFCYYNIYDYFFLENINTLHSLDTERFQFYMQNNIASTLEVICKQGEKIKALICFDIYKPTRSFPREKIVFSLLVTKLIAPNI